MERRPWHVVCVQSLDLIPEEEEGYMRRILWALVVVSAFFVVLTGCSTDEGKTTVSERARITDSELESQIKAKLSSDPQVRAADLRVSADAGKHEATISGTVESAAVRTKAIDLARSAHAGLSVTDKIEVKARELSRADYTEDYAREARMKAKEYGEQIGDTLDDAWIHTKIVAKLIGNTVTPERKINVDVVNNVVTLRGTVETAEQKAEAGRIAKETDGVKSVRNQIKVGAGRTGG
jgi:hyperosmotically inducible protein